MALQEIARALHAGKLTEGRTKGDVKELIAKYPNGVQITGADILHDQKRGTDYVCFTIAEEPEKFYFGGSVVTKYFSELIAACGGKASFDEALNMETLNVSFAEQRSKNGNVYVSVVTL